MAIRFSEERRKQISETNKRLGIRPPSRKGTKLSEEQKQKLRGKHTNLGIKRTAENKNKISKTHKKLGIRPPSRAGMLPWNKGLKGFQGGDKSHLWRGGITTLRNSIRGLFEYRQWRSDVYKRDNYKCQWCGIGGKIEADHIKPFSIILDTYKITSIQEALDCAELWDINNGRTLCRDCHKTTDSYLKRIKK